MDDDSLWSDEDDDELLAAWAEVDRQAADVLRTACAEVLQEAPPQPDLAEEAGSLRREVEASARSVRSFDVACGWAGAPPEDDVQMWLQALASTISPSEELGTSPEEQAAVFSLQHADWLGGIVGLVRRGVGAEFDADGWSQDLAAVPEVDDKSEDVDDDVAAFSVPVEVLAPSWQTLGVLDEDRCLTPLGRWGLPHALLSAWEDTAAAPPDQLDEEVGLPGTSQHGEPDWLTDAQREAHRAWREALGAHRDGDLPTAAELVALSEGLEGVVGDLAAYEVAADPDREPLVVAMQEAVTGKARAVPLYLRARVAEVRGDAQAMSSLLEECLVADPGAVDAAADLAELRAVAGDAAEAQRLFTLAGLERDAMEVKALRPFLSPPAGETGRNKPCPCGSGRKYKLCHGRTALHPMPDRAAWLMTKVVGYLQRGHNREGLLHWAGLMSGEERSSRETVTLAMHDATTWDFALFDGGILADFLALYRPLLPPDEAQLAESWVTTDRRLLEVTEVTPMRGLTCRDLVTGERLELSDRTLSRSVQPMDLLLGRPLDYGDGVQKFWNDPVDIPRWLRPRLLDLLRSGAEPEAIAAFFAPASRTPVLQTTEGEELVMCTARYEVPDLDTAWLALSAELDGDGDGEVLHHVVEVPGGQSLVRGTVRRASDRIVLETMALERLRELQTLVLAIVPDARLVDESTRSAADAFAETGPDLPPQDAAPELAAEDIASLVRQHEDRWLSERIPALGGLTPREAAADPAAREELIALLDDFEWQDRRTPNAFSMDVHRIRAGLGLS